jgi:predicted nucleotidyltransferase
MVALQTAPDLNSVFGPRGNDFLCRAVTALLEQLPVEEIWMFGSCARGMARSDSDLDLLVVLEDGHGILRPTAECFRILFCLRDVVPTDVVALSRSQWEHEKAHPFGMYGEILREGVIVYAK